MVKTGRYAPIVPTTARSGGSSWARANRRSPLVVTSAALPAMSRAIQSAISRPASWASRAFCVRILIRCSAFRYPSVSIVALFELNGTEKAPASA